MKKSARTETDLPIRDSEQSANSAADQKNPTHHHQRSLLQILTYLTTLCQQG